MSKYSLAVMERVRYSLGLEEDDESRDAEIEAMSSEELFVRCLEWEGIIGYSETIKSMIRDIYKVKL